MINAIIIAVLVVAAIGGIRALVKRSGGDCGCGCGCSEKKAKEKSNN